MIALALLQMGCSLLDSGGPEEEAYPPMRTDCKPNAGVTANRQGVYPLMGLESEVRNAGVDPATRVGCVYEVTFGTVLGTTPDGWISLKSAQDVVMIKADRAYVDGTGVRDRNVQFLGPRSFTKADGSNATKLSARFIAGPDAGASTTGSQAPASPLTLEEMMQRAREDEAALGEPTPE